MLSHVRLFVTPWTVARQTPLSMGFSRQEYCWAPNYHNETTAIYKAASEPGTVQAHSHWLTKTSNNHSMENYY